MNHLNPNAVNFWALGGVVGYLCDGTTGCLWGLAGTLAVTLVLSLFGK